MSDAPRLLFVPAFLGPHGGLENHVLAHARVAADLGYRVRVVTPRPIPPGPLGPALRDVAVVEDAESSWRRTASSRVLRTGAFVRVTARTRRLPDASRRATLAGDRARGYIEAFWPGDGRTLLTATDVVHFVGKPKPFVVEGIRAAHGLGLAPVYNEIAQVTPEYAARPDLRGFADVAALCHRVEVISERQGDDLCRWFGYTGTPVVVEQWADELEDALLAVARPTRPAGADVIVGSLCRLSPEKDLETVVRGFAKASAARPELRLRVGGTGDGAEALQSLVRRLGISDTVELVGFVEDRVAFYRDLDVFVVASREEGGPITAVEAMAAGVPLVTTPCGGMPDRVREGVEGMFIPVGDPDGLAQGLLRLLDRDLRELGQHARARYETRHHSRLQRDRLADLWSGARRAPTPA